MTDSIDTKGGHGCVLVVDDEPMVRWSIRNFLETRDFHVLEAADGGEALGVLSSARVHVVVAAWDAAGVDGLGLVGRLGRDYPEMQVIVMVRHAGREGRLHAFRQGVFDCIEKPFDLELLLVRVENAVEKCRMMEELIRLSRTDGLTGLFNLRFFYQVLEGEMQRSRRQGRPLSLILVDVDSFKEYNDRHGHLAGDEVLARVAASLAEACRHDVDRVFRYGGDEFMVVLPEADLETARAVCNRIHGLVSRLGFRPVTLSVGLAEMQPGQDMKSFIRNADEAMYLAKQMGGDRSVVFSDCV